ncbi:unnamed protein product, partial [Phaeothamnion confervicola]
SLLPPPAPPPAEAVQLRVMTFNVWHNQPAAWVVPDPEERWLRYRERLRHLIAFIVEEAPDIVALQEVRHDVGCGPHGSNGQQISHFAEALPDYQYVYQPAEAGEFLHLEDPTSRVEEGVALLSRHPVLSQGYVLLPRVPGDRADNHQRVCLHVEVRWCDGDGELFVLHC